MDRLPVRERDDGEQRRDDEADRDRVRERADAGDDERREDEVGGVGDRRQRVGRQDREPGDARQALVMRHARRDRLAEQQSFQ